MVTTVGELLDRLSGFPREATAFFGGSEDALEFKRVKARGGGVDGPITLVQIEFSQQVYRKQDGTLIAHDIR